MGLSLSKRYKNEIRLVTEIIRTNFGNSTIGSYKRCIQHKFFRFNYSITSEFWLYLVQMVLPKIVIKDFSVYEVNKKVYIGLDLTKIDYDCFSFESFNPNKYESGNIFNGYAGNEVDDITLSCIYYMLEHDCRQAEKTSKFDIVPFEICKEYGLAEIDGNSKVYKVNDLAFLHSMVSNLYHKNKIQNLECWKKVHKCVESVINNVCLVLKPGYFKTIENRKFLPICEIDFNKDVIKVCIQFQNDSADLKKFNFSDFIQVGNGYGYYLPMYACVMWDGKKYYADGTYYFP